MVNGQWVRQAGTGVAVIGIVCTRVVDSGGSTYFMYLESICLAWCWSNDYLNNGYLGSIYYHSNMGKGYYDTGDNVNVFFWY